MNKKRAAKRASVIAGSEMQMPDLSVITLDNPNHRILLWRAFNYANYIFDTKFQKQQVVEFMKEHMNLKGGCIPENQLPHKGNICWLYKNGVEGLPIEELEDDLKDLHTKYSKTKEKDRNTKLTHTQVINKNTNSVIGMLEGIIDDVYLGKKDIQQPIDIFRAANIKIPVIEAWFQRQIDEMKANPDDYKKAKKEKAAIKFIMNHIEAYKTELDDKIVRQTKRKARKKKIIPSKMVTHMKYLKKDDDLKLKSVPAKNIVGASVLWVFNTKNRFLTQYTANDDVGLMVRRSAVINFNVDKSCEKRIRANKVEEILIGLQEAGKVEQRTYLDKINSKAIEPKGRINANCILFKVYK